MAVQFNNIPGNIRVPLFYAEFQSGGTPYQQNARLLLIGQKRSTGTAAPDVPVLMRDGQEDGFFGRHSMLAQMYRVARDNAPFQEIWCLPVEDDAAGVAASGSITIAGAPLTAAATLAVYIAGVRVRIAVKTTDTNANIAANLIAAINATEGLPVTALVDGVNTAKINLTARHKGALGNEIAIDTDLIGDEDPVTRATMTVAAMTGGAGDPDIADALDSLGAEEFDWIGSPYADAANLGRASDLLNDDSGRWSPMLQLYGHYITAKAGNLAALSTLGLSRNDQHTSILGYYKSPSPPWVWAAAAAARAAQHLQSAPELSRPLHTIDLRGVIAPKIADRFNVTERQVLYYDGIAGYHVERDGTVSIDRLITTYQLNEWGAPDATWLDVETLAQSIFGIRYLKTKVTSAHARQALADSNPFGLQGVTTAEDVRATFVHGYAELVALGVFENLDLFERDLIVERSVSDANRVDAYLPLDHVNQLRIIAVNATSFLQRRSAAEQLVA
jgi:phage tail sheath gpL-like